MAPLFGDGSSSSSIFGKRSTPQLLTPDATPEPELSKKAQGKQPAKEKSKKKQKLIASQENGLLTPRATPDPRSRTPSPEVERNQADAQLATTKKKTIRTKDANEAKKKKAKAEKKKAKHTKKIEAAPMSPQASNEAEAATSSATEQQVINRIMASDHNNPYDVLGFSQETPQEERKKQIRKLTLSMHPDHNKHNLATDAFRGKFIMF